MQELNSFEIDEVNGGIVMVVVAVVVVVGVLVGVGAAAGWRDEAKKAAK